MSCRNGGFHRAYQLGMEAALALPQRRRSSNPYQDHRTHHGDVTYGRAWWRAWDDGWHSGNQTAQETKLGDSS